MIGMSQQPNHNVVTQINFGYHFIDYFNGNI